MTTAEIVAEDAANAGLAAVGTDKNTMPDIQLEVFELAESGETIEFPMNDTKPAPDDSAIAGGAFDHEDLSI